MKKNESSEASDPTSSSAEEIEKVDEKKVRTERKTTRTRVLYEIDAANLKLADRNKRISISVGFASVELALVFIVSYLMGTTELMLVGFVLLLIVVFFFLPTAFPFAPAKYKITKQGIFFNGEKAFPLAKKHRLKVNQNRNFISVRERKGEVLKLYTTETEKVMKILDKIIASDTKSSLRK